jgi:hypothetical protein
MSPGSACVINDMFDHEMQARTHWANTGQRDIGPTHAFSRLAKVHATDLARKPGALHWLLTTNPVDLLYDCSHNT